MTILKDVMKNATPAILGSLLLSGIMLMTPVSGKVTTETNTKEALWTEADIEARLKTITVEDFKIEKVPLSQALVHLDNVLEPHGLQIKFRPTKEKDPVVQLKTRNLTMARNLSFLSQQVGYDWWVEDGVIIVATPGSGDALVTEFIPVKSTTVRRLTYSQGF